MIGTRTVEVMAVERKNDMTYLTLRWSDDGERVWTSVVSAPWALNVAVGDTIPIRRFMAVPPPEDFSIGFKP